ncbi:hypothetical protein ULF88_04420 [Halopseudomonas pachastrellae]|nr:hypothetical protein [Halopseudomonas pachastrellae]
MKLGLPRYLTLGLLLAAGAALALAVGYWNISPGSFAPATVERDNARPDFYIDNARIQMLDEQGKGCLSPDRRTCRAPDRRWQHPP